MGFDLLRARKMADLSMHSGGHNRQSAAGLTAANSPARSIAELRGAPRFNLMLRVAKLVIDGREQFCVIRDASATGLKVKLFGPLPPHAALAVEMANGDRHDAQCMWMTTDHAGLRFRDPTELERLIEEAKGVGQRRHVRLRIALDAMLFSGGAMVPVAMRDISQQGAAVDSGKWLRLNQLVKFETAILPTLYAKVRWRNRPHYGVIFEQTFQLQELAHRCAGLPAPRLALHGTSTTATIEDTASGEDGTQSTLRDYPRLVDHFQLGHQVERYEGLWRLAN